MNEKGFTLGEILVILAIISIFAAISIASGVKIKEKVRTNRGAAFDKEVLLTVGYDLVGEYTFEDNTNLGKDTSSFFNHADSQDWPASTEGFNENSSALAFTGVQCLELNEVFDSKSLTLSAWIYPTSMGADNYRIVTRDQSDYWTLGQGNNNSIIFKVYLGNIKTLSTDSETLRLDHWHHVIGTYDNLDGYAKIYVDGKEVAKSNFGATDNIIGIGSERAIGIGNKTEGSCNPSSSYGFRGSIDDVRIYKEALSLAKIQDIYKQDLEKYSELAFNN